MAGRMIRKLVQLTIVMILISFLSFGVIYIAPGDISNMYINAEMSYEEIERVKDELGVNDSFLVQYWRWAKRAIHGDLGISYSSRISVTQLFADRLPATLFLMGTALILSIAFAIPLGLICAYKENTVFDSIISTFCYIGMSVPSFWLGILFILIFSVKLGIFPTSGIHTIGVNTFGDVLRHTIMPAMTLCAANLASFVRYTRSSAIDEMNSGYVITAKSKGTNSNNVLKRHVLKNSLLPLITLVGMNLPSLVTGSFVIETVFGWPGIGTLAYSAIGLRDFPIIMAYVLLSGFILVIGNLLADICYTIVDPRIRLGDGDKYGRC